MSVASPTPDTGRGYAAWAAILSAIGMLGTLVFYAMATGGDLEAMARPATALTLTPAAQRWFLLSMICDAFGFYLPFLLIAPYLAAQLRPRFGAPIEMATFGIGCYVALGLAGGAIQIATLPALAAAHAIADPPAQAASESAWLAVVAATQSGLWWIEQTLLAFWAVVIGRAMYASGERLGLLMVGIGVLAGGYFVVSLLGALDLALLLELVLIFALTLWALLTGVTLLRQPKPMEVTAAA